MPELLGGCCVEEEEDEDGVCTRSPSPFSDDILLASSNFSIFSTLMLPSVVLSPSSRSVQ